MSDGQEPLSKIEQRQIINEYGRINQTSNEKTVIYSTEEYPTLEAALAFPIKATVRILALPFTQWEEVNPSAKPEPKEIGVATIHVRILSLKAWMDGKVTTKIKNTGDVDFEESVQDKVTFKETKTSKKIKYVKDAKKSIGDLAEGKTHSWGVSWKVDGIWNIFKALVSILKTGKLRTTFTCRFEADYTVHGTFMFIIPQTKTETYSKSYKVDADVVIRKFRTDIRL